jgi:hypothetical protein
LPPLDLTRYSEKTRRALFDRIEADHFSPNPRTILDVIARGDFAETRTADEAGLRIHYILGRWFAYWRVSEPIENPTERDLWEVVTVTASPRGVLSMAEV